MGPKPGRTRPPAFVVAAVVLIATLQPWVGALPPTDPGDCGSNGGPGGRNGASEPPPAGVGVPSHYADSYMLSGHLRYNRNQGPTPTFFFPEEPTASGARFLAVDNDGKVYRFVQEGQLLRMDEYVSLFYDGGGGNPHLVEVEGGRRVLVTTDGYGKVLSRWADDLEPRSILHTSASILGVGDWDGDGLDEVWLRTTYRMLLLLNITTGQPVAISGERLPDSIFSYNPVCADLDGDGRDELVFVVDDREIWTASGDDLDIMKVHHFYGASYIEELRVGPRNGSRDTLVGILSHGGIMHLDQASGLLKLLDIDIGSFCDVVFIEGSTPAEVTWFYLLYWNGTLVRSDGTGNRTWAELGSRYDDGGVSLAFVRGNEGQLYVIARTLDTPPVLVDPDDLHTIARAEGGPRSSRFLLGVPNLRDLGLPGDALVVSDAIHLLDVENRTLTHLIDIHRPDLVAWWPGDGFHEPCLITGVLDSDSTTLNRFNIKDDTLYHSGSQYQYSAFSWIQILERPGDDPWLIAFSAPNLYSINLTTLRTTPVRSIGGRVHTVGDVDGDGVEELLYQNESHGLRCVDPAAFEVEWTLDLDSTLNCMLVADIDADPGPELVLAYGEGRLDVLDNATREVLYTTGPDIVDVTSMTAADLDRDGDIELAVARRNYVDLMVLGPAPGGGLEEEWHWWGHYRDHPELQGTLAVEGVPYLPILRVSPFVVLGFSEAALIGDVNMTDLDLASERPVEGDEVHLNATLSLDGGFPTDVLVELYDIDPYRDDGDGMVDRTWVHLEPGQEVTVGLNCTAELGERTYWVVANSVRWHGVAERDYTNNVANVTFIVSRPFMELAWSIGIGESRCLPGGCHAADVDGDGRDELVLADAVGHIGIVDLEGGEGFARWDWRSPLLGDAPLSLALWDIDGDSVEEAVVASRDGWVSVIDLGDGEVVTRRKVTPSGLVNVELVRDPLAGSTRIVVLDVLAVLHFLDPSNLEAVGSSVTCWEGSFMEVCELDGDGADDLVVLGTGGLVAVHTMGGLGPRTLLDASWEHMVDTATGDLDGDGYDEVAVASSDRLLVLDLTDEDGWRTDVVAASMDLGGTASGIGIADWDWDGQPEVLVAGTSLHLIGATFAPNGSWEGLVEESVHVLPFEANGVAAGRFGDQAGLRAAAPLRDGTVALLDGYGEEVEVVFEGLGVQTLSLATGDVDGDGIPEVIAGTAFAGVRAIEGISLEGAYDLDTGPAWTLATGDWDGDGALEAVLQDGEGDLVLLGANGTRKLEGDWTVEGTVMAMVPLDVGGDGVLDLAWAEEDWTVHVLNMTSMEVKDLEWTQKVPVELHAARFPDGGDRLVIPERQGVSVYHATTLNRYVRIPLFGDLVALTVFPPSDAPAPLALAADANGVLHLLDLLSGDELGIRYLGDEITHLLARDLDQDDSVEVVVVDSNGTVRVLDGGTLEDLITPRRPTSSAVSVLAADDVDLDGATELILGGWSELTALRVGTGIALPDLVLEVVDVPEGELAGGESFEVVFRVRNRGMGDTGEFALNLSMNGEAAGGVNLSLGPLESADLAFQVEVKAWDTVYTLVLVVDLLDAVTELDEDNNALEVTLRTMPPPGPVLLVTNLTLDPETPLEGAVATLGLEVANVGERWFNGRVVVTGLGPELGEVKLFEDLLSVDVSRTLALSMELEGIHNGTTLLRIVLEDTEGVELSSAELPMVVVGRADLELMELLVDRTLSPIGAVGLPFNLTATVLNSGSVPGRGHLVLQRVVDGTVVPLDVAWVSLEPGEVGNVTLGFVPREGGPYDLEAWISPEGDDIDEGNDRASLILVMGPHPRSQITIQDFLATRRDGTSVHVTAVVEVGDGITGSGDLDLRVYALEGATIVPVEGAVVKVPSGAFPLIFNTSRPAVGGQIELFDAVLDIAPLLEGTGIDPEGEVVLLAVVDFVIMNRSVQVGYSLVGLPSIEEVDGEDEEMDTWLFMFLIVLIDSIIIIVIINVLTYFYRSRLKDEGEPGGKGEEKEPDDVGEENPSDSDED